MGEDSANPKKFHEKEARTMKRPNRAVWLGLVILLLVPGIGLTQTAACGDQNGDGLLGVSDVFYLINHLFAGGPAPVCSRPPAPVARTGQTTCYDLAGVVIACGGTGQDGDLLKGAVWPNPRFTDKGNGTVTDNLTGLVWLKNANCATINPATWSNALVNANTLASGACGLTDGSVAGDWRLPNLEELQSLIDYNYSNVALSNAAGTGQWAEGNAFSGVQQQQYWSSTTYPYSPLSAWYVHLYYGWVGAFQKNQAYYVWPVRG
jgi:Protein of unknown function (DUF1566)